MRRIVNFMPYFKLTNFIIYKAEWEGVSVVLLNEAYTSKLCYRCGKEGKRLSQARFKCPNCGLDYFNADLNATINLAKRSSSYMGENGASVNMPLTAPPSVEAPCVSWE